MAFRAYSAKNAVVRIATVTFTAKAWEVTTETDELETTNFESGGYFENIGGITKATASITLNENGLGNLFDAGITAGATLTNVFLYLNTTAGPKWQLSSFYVRSVQTRADVKGAMEVVIQGNATATFSYPTGNAVS